MVHTKHYLFSSESVAEGHPDKICDQISDAILDAALKQDPSSRVACETFATHGLIVIAGEITTKAHLNFQNIARDVLKDIGYINTDFGLNYQKCAILTAINKQSPDIARGVNIYSDHEQGAGDQGLMFGYATDETPELMPLPIMLAHNLTKQLAFVRHQNILPWLRPDGKAQVTIEYHNNTPHHIHTVVLSAQHHPDVAYDILKQALLTHVIYPVCQHYCAKTTNYFINATGAFTIGGPEGDTGLTGRKIIVDTYGGMGRHGGGCFSGKDPSKVDRSASYMARHIAKNIVAAGLAKQCEVQIAYCIGIAEPVSLYVNTNHTAQVPDDLLTQAVRALFPLKPKQIIDYLALNAPIYRKTSVYGHFGRTEPEFTWEQTNQIETLKKYIQEHAKSKN